MEVAANPPKIGPRSEVSVSTESITKEVISSRDRTVSWQWKVTGPAVVAGNEPRHRAPQKHLVPDHDLSSLLLSPSLLGVPGQ